MINYSDNRIEHVDTSGILIGIKAQIIKISPLKETIVKDIRKLKHLFKQRFLSRVKLKQAPTHTVFL